MSAASGESGAAAKRPRGGPRTSAGKRRSSRNALRHGLTATAVVVPEVGERPVTLRRKLAAYREALAPVGGLELDLVERLAHLQLRQDRATRWEGAIWRRAALEAQRDAATSRGVQALAAVAALELRPRLQDGGLAGDGTDPARLELLARVLEAAAGRLEDAALLAAEGKAGTAAQPGEAVSEARSARVMLAWVYGEPRPIDPETPGDDGPAAACVAETLDAPLIWELSDVEERILEGGAEGAELAVTAPISALREEAERLLARAAELREQDAQLKAANVAGAALPLEELERLGRYEAAVSREYARTLDRLERLQRLRAGEELPAPARLAVDVTVDATDA